MAQNIVKPVDSALQFIQESFNTEDDGWGAIVNSLDRLTKSIQKEQGKRNDIRLAKLEELQDRKQDLKVIEDKVLFDRFEDITNAMDISKIGAMRVYKLTSDLVYDLEKARNWLGEYQKLLKTGFPDAMEQLIAFGKALLGKAVENAPILTGLLRESAFLAVFNGYILVGFAAPYATYVHENMEAHHTYGMAKYLERAAQEFMPDRETWVDILGEDIVLMKITINYDVEFKHHGTY